MSQMIRESSIQDGGRNGKHDFRKKKCDVDGQDSRRYWHRYSLFLMVWSLIRQVGERGVQRGD
jgi:hypothetical protein